MLDICCIGHITSDKVVTPGAVKHMPGGTAWYFSQALANLNVKYTLVTSLAAAEMEYVTTLRSNGVKVKVQPSKHTVIFENIYGNNLDERLQYVLQKADPFTLDQLTFIDAKIFHLGPLLTDDIPVDLIKYLAKKGKVSLDVQGYLRKVVDEKVYPTGWFDKFEALQYVSILKADEAELYALTGQQNVRDGINLLAAWGLQEIVITNGSQGSLIYNNGLYYNIPAYPPKQIIDTTGCGDTYMAGYLYQRVKGEAIQQSAQFAAAISGLKTKSAGPFMGTEEEVMDFLESRP